MIAFAEQVAAAALGVFASVLVIVASGPVIKRRMLAKARKARARR